MDYTTLTAKPRPGTPLETVSVLSLYEVLQGLPDPRRAQGNRGGRDESGRSMIEVYPGLFIGNRVDYETIVSGQDGWAIVHACWSYHRMAVGYRVRSVAKGHADYLVAHRENRLMLCLLDMPIAVPIEREMIERTLDFIDRMRAEGRKVLVPCVYGRSRSPSIMLLYMAARLRALPGDSLEAAETRFRQVYPRYKPNRSIREHLRRYWREYCAD